MQKQYDNLSSYVSFWFLQYWYYWLFWTGYRPTLPIPLSRCIFPVGTPRFDSLSPTLSLARHCTTSLVRIVRYRSGCTEFGYRYRRTFCRGRTLTCFEHMVRENRWYSNCANFPQIGHFLCRHRCFSSNCPYTSSNDFWHFVHLIKLSQTDGASPLNCLWCS